MTLWNSPASDWCWDRREFFSFYFRATLFNKLIGVCLISCMLWNFAMAAGGNPAFPGKVLWFCVEDKLSTIFLLGPHTCARVWDLTRQSSQDRALAWYFTLVQGYIIITVTQKIGFPCSVYIYQVSIVLPTLSGFNYIDFTIAYKFGSKIKFSFASRPI